jgi:hypothetical protein
MWALQRALVAKKWGWFWEGARVVLPLWEGGGDVFDKANGLQGANNNLSWRGGSPEYNAINGEQFTFANSPIFDEAAPQLTLAALVTVNFTQTDFVTRSIIDNTVDNADGYRLFFSAGVDDFRFRLPFNTQNLDTVGASFVAGDVLHIVGTYDGPNLLMTIYYKNLTTGQILLNTLATGTNNVQPTGDPLLIGESSSGDGPWDGLIHMVYIGYRTWSESQVLAHRRDPFGPFRMADEVGVVVGLPVAVGGPHGPLGHPLWGPFAGPVAA